MAKRPGSWIGRTSPAAASGLRPAKGSWPGWRLASTATAKPNVGRRRSWGGGGLCLSRVTLSGRVVAGLGRAPAFDPRISSPSGEHPITRSTAFSRCRPPLSGGAPNGIVPRPARRAQLAAVDALTVTVNLSPSGSTAFSRVIPPPVGSLEIILTRSGVSADARRPYARGRCDLTLMIREGQNSVGQNDHRIVPRPARRAQLAAVDALTVTVNLSPSGSTAFSRVIPPPRREPRNNPHEIGGVGGRSAALCPRTM